MCDYAKDSEPMPEVSRGYTEKIQGAISAKRQPNLLETLETRRASLIEQLSNVEVQINFYKANPEIEKIFPQIKYY